MMRHLAGYAERVIDVPLQLLDRTRIECPRVDAGCLGLFGQLDARPSLRLRFCNRCAHEVVFTQDVAAAIGCTLDALVPFHRVQRPSYLEERRRPLCHRVLLPLSSFVARAVRTRRTHYLGALARLFGLDTGAHIEMLADSLHAQGQVIDATDHVLPGHFRALANAADGAHGPAGLARIASNPVLDVMTPDDPG